MLNSTRAFGGTFEYQFQNPSRKDLALMAQVLGNDNSPKSWMRGSGGDSESDLVGRTSGHISGDFKELIVIGGSAGSIELLPNLLRGLREKTDAPIFVVIHVSPASNGKWIHAMSRQTGLQMKPAEANCPIRRGDIIFAKGDYHLVVQSQKSTFVHGPFENKFRPSIDVLFRSAAVKHGPRVVGILLSGLLDDGCAGALAIETCGGVCLVQDPEDALFGDLPANAREVLANPIIAAASELPQALEKVLKREEPVKEIAPPVNLIREVAMGTDACSHVEDLNQIGTPSPFGCPECGGPMWKLDTGPMDRFRCHIGHSHTARSLLEAKDEQVNQALWVALRALEERIRILEKLDRKRGGSMGHFDSMAKRLSETRRHADVLRRLILNPPEEQLADPPMAEPLQESRA
jgi:two-component system chemotaxis response regulator CheB